MNELFGCMKAEIVKMRHTFLYPLHIAVPVVGSIIFLLYYHGSRWSEMTQISGYMEMIGILFPFAISVVCAWNVRLEEENHFQIFLGSSVYKWNTFLAKWLVLLGLGFMAVLVAIFLFALGYHDILGKEGLSLEICGFLFVVFCFGSVPIYLEHLFLNLMFSKTISLSIGVAQFLLSALFLTGLGDGRWLFFPCTWSARGAALFLTYVTQAEIKDILTTELKNSAMICLLIMIMIYVIIRIWFHFYEGRQCHD